MSEQKNFILAIILSFASIFAIQYFLGGKQQPVDDAALLQQEMGVDVPQIDTNLPEVDNVSNDIAADDMAFLPNGDGSVSPINAEAVEFVPRDEALAVSDRIDIHTDAIEGSISLNGGRIDDLSLARYFEELHGDEIVRLLNPQGSEGGYYADFGWIDASASGTDMPRINTVWSQDGDNPLTVETPVTLFWVNDDNIRFEREIAIDEDYMFTITQRIINNGNASLNLAPYSILTREGVPETRHFFILHEGPIGVLGGELQEVDYKDLSENRSEQNNLDSVGGWLGITDKYWLVSIIPESDEEISTRMFDKGTESHPRFQIDFVQSQREIAAGDTVEVTSRLFAGAKKVELLDEYQETYNIELFNRAIDWGMWFFLTIPFFSAINWIASIFASFGFTVNFGLAILTFTVFIKLLLFPLQNKSYVSMNKMKKLQPKIQDLRDRFTEDPQRLQKETMALYKREGVNPAAGCLPIFIMIPVFFSLYKVLFVTIEMRHAPFFGWIHDLSSPDPTSIFTLFGLVPWQVPSMLDIGIWPVIMGITMYLQQKMNPTPADKTQAMMMMMLPFVFTIMLGSFPAGLVIYWAWNNTLSVVQQWVIKRRMDADEEAK